MKTLSRPYALAQLVRDRARELGDQHVFTYQDKHLSYTELDENSDHTAKALLANGIAKGDRVAFLGKNSPAYFELIAALAKIGAVMVPVNWRLAGPELSYVLNDSAAKILFVEAEFLEAAADIETSLEHKPTIYLINAESESVKSYRELQDQGSLLAQELDRSFDADADIDVLQLYTSGTTGKPKGAVLTSRMLIALRGQDTDGDVPEWQGYEIGETGLLVMPCFHIGGTSFGWGIIYNGAHSVVLAEYNQDEVIDLIDKFRVSKAFMVPAALKSLLSNPKLDTADLSSLTHIYYGASPMPLDLMRAAIERFSCGFVQMYGMTETGGSITALTPEDHDPNASDAAVREKMNSVGKPLYGVEIKVVDESGNPLPVRASGEIVTRSVKNMKAYWNRPLSGGENVYPAEVENALYGHESIQEVAVIGVPDDKWGETVKAVVVLKEGAQQDAESIIAYSRERIAAYKCPKSIDFMDALPRNATGKVLRKDLKAPYWEGKSRGVN